MGSIVHKLIDDASRGHVQEYDLKAHMATVVAEFENSIPLESPDRRWVPVDRQPEFDWIMKQGILKAMSVLPKATSHFNTRKSGHQRVGTELRVEARNGRVIGKIDRVTETAEGIILEDFKTGSLTERPGPNAPPKIAFADQLRLYAAMYAEDPTRGNGEWPAMLTLRSLSGTSLNISFSRSECTDLLDTAVKLLDGVNTILESYSRDEAMELLSRPDPDTCRFCAYRPVCPSYRHVRADGQFESQWPRDYWGIVVDKTHLGNRNISLSLDTFAGIVRARAFNPVVHPNLESIQLGDEVAVFSASFQHGVCTIGDGPYATIIDISD
jgi:hypothetical protein